jgi:hypothetical protein
LTLVVALGLVTGCTSSGSSAPRSPSPTPTPTPSATTPAGAVLQQLADVAAGARYHAVYRVRAQHPKSSATWGVWRTPGSLRLDVLTRKQRTTLIVTARASFACRSAQHRRTCFRVARSHDPVPREFRLVATKLFSTDVAALRAHINDYTVSTGAPRPASGPRPAATCFAVRPAAAAKPPRVDRATYCLSADGVLTAVDYPSGSTVRLQSVELHPPARSVFVPYSSPTPLPD